MSTLRLGIVGDTQRVLPIERLAFQRETNDVGRRRVAQALLAEPLDLLIHLGDFVGAASGWTRFDQDYPPSALRGRPFAVCRGNHDCGGFWFGSPKEFNRRYAHAVGRIQRVELGILQVILIDTNHTAMSGSAWQTQIAEFRSALDAANQNDRVKHVIVAGHHPPYTNARWHAPSKAVLDAFVPLFLSCEKSRLFLSGHVHGYERFQVEARTFVVTGGGGGARFSHRHGANCLQTAEVDLDDPHPLHYVLAEVGAEGVTFEVRGLDAAGEGFVVLDRFD